MKASCYVSLDNERCILFASEKATPNADTMCYINIVGWNLFLSSKAPLYRLTEDGMPVRRTDAEIRRSLMGT